MITASVMKDLKPCFWFYLAYPKLFLEIEINQGIRKRAPSKSPISVDIMGDLL